VVATELGVGTLERRVSVGLGLVDTVCAFALVSSSSDFASPFQCVIHRRDASISVAGGRRSIAYPFL
jgi:hypothetical protein